jgi:hypothetical protein
MEIRLIPPRVQESIISFVKSSGFTSIVNSSKDFWPVDLWICDAKNSINSGPRRLGVPPPM